MITAVLPALLLSSEKGLCVHSPDPSGYEQLGAGQPGRGGSIASVPSVWPGQGRAAPLQSVLHQQARCQRALWAEQTHRLGESARWDEAMCFTSLSLLWRSDRLCWNHLFKNLLAFVDANCSTSHDTFFFTKLIFSFSSLFHYLSYFWVIFFYLNILILNDHGTGQRGG